MTSSDAHPAGNMLSSAHLLSLAMAPADLTLNLSPAWRGAMKTFECTCVVETLLGVLAAMSYRKRTHERGTGTQGGQFACFRLISSEQPCESCRDLRVQTLGSELS